MENYSSYLPLVYYASGIISGVILVFLMGNKTPLKVPKRLKTWSKITNLEYIYDVDYEFKQKLSGQQLAYLLTEVMKLKIEQEPGWLKDITLDPACYRIHLETHVRFVETDKEILAK